MGVRLRINNRLYKEELQSRADKREDNELVLWKYLNFGKYTDNQREITFINSTDDYSLKEMYRLCQRNLMQQNIFDK